MDLITMLEAALLIRRRGIENNATVNEDKSPEEEWSDEEPPSLQATNLNSNG